jgi:NADPH:quinone reductase-like Zn-dependent oxidoreductase
VPADALVQLPDSIDDETVASLMMQGLTASHFARSMQSSPEMRRWFIQPQAE